MSTIVKGLYLGDQDDACDQEWLEEHNIQVILNCAKEVNCFIPEDVSAFKILLEDTSDQDILSYLEPSVKIIDEAIDNREPILVHCGLGKSRSASIVIYWLMTRVYGGDLEKAINHVKKKRSIINPNVGFLTQLASVSSSGLGKRSCRQKGKK